MANRKTLSALALAILCVMPFAAAGQQIDGDDPQKDALSSVFGAFSLTTDDLKFSTDQESGAPLRMVIRGSVNIVSDRMTLICDEVTIDFTSQMLVARGKIVKFKMEGIDGECGVLNYSIDGGKAVLEGPHKPVITQRTPDGEGRSSSADRITITQGEKSNDVHWDGHVEMSMQRKNPPPVAGPGDPRPPARKIDRATIGARIRKPPPPKKG